MKSKMQTSEIYDQNLSTLLALMLTHLSYINLCSNKNISTTEKLNNCHMHTCQAMLLLLARSPSAINVKHFINDFNCYIVAVTNQVLSLVNVLMSTFLTIQNFYDTNSSHCIHSLLSEFTRKIFRSTKTE